MSKLTKNFVAQSSGARPVVEIRHSALAGAGLVRVIIDATGNRDGKAVASALRDKTGGRLEAISGSFSVLNEGSFTTRLSGLMGVVRPIVHIGCAADMKGFTAFASNMFVDNEENMWKLHKTGSGQVLVQSTGLEDEADLRHLLASCSSASMAHTQPSEFRTMVAQASALSDNVQGGDFISYCGAMNTVVHGFAVATDPESRDVMVVSISGDEEIVSTSAVTAVHDVSDCPPVELDKAESVEVAMSAASSVDVNVLVNYYRRIYGKWPAYFAQLVQRINSHRFAM